LATPPTQNRRSRHHTTPFSNLTQPPPSQLRTVTTTPHQHPRNTSNSEPSQSPRHHPYLKYDTATTIPT
ncbi:hypothetical protein L195_g049753, partial [Trifolium pratense]